MEPVTSLYTAPVAGVESEKEVQYENRELGGSKSDSKSDLDITQPDWTQAEETALRHKIDHRIVPLVTVLYLLCFLDRVNIGNARIQGMARDLDLDVGVRFNWAGSIFYIIYLLFEVPSNIVLKRIGPRFFLPFLVVGFGFVSMCTAFTTSFNGLMVARVFLGVFEGGAMPGMAFFLSTFYRREELLFRIGIYVSAASMAGAFGGLLATGLSRIPPWGASSMVLHEWRNIYFFEGIITMVVGLLAPIWMPHSPSTARFLSERERHIAAARLVLEHKANPDEHVTWAHFKRAICCIHNYTCALGFFLINITVQGLSIFMPTILKDLGWIDIKAQLMTVPVYAAACLVAIAVAYVSDKTRLRGVYLAGFSTISLIGFALLRWHTDTNIRYMAVYFVCVGAFPGGPGFLSWALNNTGGPAVRAVSSGYVVALGTIGGIVASWTYTTKDAPKYPVGHSINLGGQIAVVILSIFGILYCSWENRQRAAGKRNHRLDGLTPEQEIELGYRHPNFRYML